MGMKQPQSLSALRKWFNDRMLAPYDAASVKKQRALWVQRASLVLFFAVLLFFFISTYSEHRITSISIVPHQKLLLPSFALEPSTSSGLILGLQAILMRGQLEYSSTCDLDLGSCVWDVTGDGVWDENIVESWKNGLDIVGRSDLGDDDPDDCFYDAVESNGAGIRANEAWSAKRGDIVMLTVYTTLQTKDALYVTLDAENGDQMFCDTSFATTAQTEVQFTLSKSTTFYSNTTKQITYPIAFTPDIPTTAYNDKFIEHLTTRTGADVSVLTFIIVPDTVETVTKLENNRELAVRILAATLGAFGGIVTATSMLLNAFNFVAFKKEEGIPHNIREPMLYLLQQRDAKGSISIEMPGLP